MHKNVFTAFIVIVIVCNVTSVIPPNIKVCPRSSPRLAECFASSMESLRPYLKTGNFAEGFVTEGLDPLSLGDIILNKGFQMKLNNALATGISTFKIDKIRVSLAPVKVELILSIPKLTTKSFYNLDWKLGPLNLQGKGNSASMVENVRVLVKMFGSTYLRNQVEYAKIDSVKISLKYQNIRSRFENLFNGQKSLEDAANAIINQNINVIAKELVPQVEKGLERKILKVVNQFLEKASFAEFFP